MVATVRVFPNGCTGGVPGPGQKNPPKRGRCGGWTQAACRRNTQFLYSVDCSALTGVGYAITLTLAMCPATHDEWTRLCKRFMDRVYRLGVVRLHWVTEMQARGVPHLHGALFFDDDGRDLRVLILSAWLEVAAEYGARASGQHTERIYDARGWWQYVSKHAARGIRHYQRNPENLPKGWQGITGRMWGKRGDWPTVDAGQLRMSHPAWHRLRRLVRSWRVAKARREGSPRGIGRARRMLKIPSEERARVAGWSEWVPEEVMAQLVALIAAQGYEIRG